MTGWPANPNLVRHLKSTLIWTGVHVDEAVMGLSVHTDEDGGGDNPLLEDARLDVDKAVLTSPRAGYAAPDSLLHSTALNGRFCRVTFQVNIILCLYFIPCSTIVPFSSGDR